MTERVPGCPDCGEAGIPVKGKLNWFRCSIRQCGAVWKEVDWEDRIALEQKLLAESKRFEGVNALISLGNICCDECDRTIAYLEKYCYDTREEGGKRYCEECSLKAGHLKMVKNIRTGEIYPVRLLISHEVPLWEAGEVTVKKVENKVSPFDTLDALCKSCGHHLIRLKWGSKWSGMERYIPVCDNINCVLYHSPQREVRHGQTE